MIRKIIGLGILVAMIFTLVACNPDDLAQYKADAKAAIDAHVAALDEDGYSLENWTFIGQRADEGKMAVDEAKSNAEVDAAKTGAIQAINVILPKGVSMELGTELESQIKADFLQEFGYELHLNNEGVNKFYGLYNGAAVFFLAGDDAAIKTVTISDVEFSYSYGWTILVWKDGAFFNLEEIETIFDAGVLAQADLVRIAAIHNANNAG